MWNKNQHHYFSPHRTSQLQDYTCTGKFPYIYDFMFFGT